MAYWIFWLCVLGIIYTYAGYPALLALLARLRPKFRPAALPDEQLPSLTVLVAAYNEEAVIEQKILNCLELDYPPHLRQILIAADGSSDATAEITARYAARGIELSYIPERQGKMAAINRAMQAARGEIVVFSDANNLYDPQALRCLAAAFADPRVGAASGAKKILKGDGALGDSEGFYWKYEAFIKKQETRLGTSTGVVGEILALRRSLFAAPPARVINDDFYLAMQVNRAGYRVVYVPEAASFERVSQTAQDEITRRARIVAGRYQAMLLLPSLVSWRQPGVAWQVISHKFMRPLVPLAMLGALAANAAAMIWPASSGPHAFLNFLRLAEPWNFVFGLAQVLFYVLAGLGSRLPLRGQLGRVLYLPAFLVNSNFAALVGLFRFLTRRQTTLWKRVQRRGESSSSSKG